MVFISLTEPNPIQEIQEDIQLCQQYCDVKEQENSNITNCIFQYQTEITNAEHEPWELFHCMLYIEKEDGTYMYGKFVGDL